jgi:DNA-binding beta-propeller fold protein YncE
MSTHSMRSRRIGSVVDSRRVLLLLGVLLAVSLVVAGRADAFAGYSTPTFFGGEGSGNGQFKEPAGVAVDDASKEVYVYDSGNLRVERLSLAGKFEGQFNGSASPTGQFTAPVSISEHAAHGTLFNLAVDNDPASPSVGDVYVVDPGHNVIDKFSATGAYLSQLTGFKAPIFGVAVDTSGDVWVAEEGSEEGGNHGLVQEFDNGLLNTHLTSELSAEALRSPGIAVDGEQNLYLLRGEPNVIKVNKQGATLVGEGLTTCGCGKALAFDSSAEKLFFDEGSSIAIYPGSAEAGTPPTETIAGLSSSFGLAVDAATHALYASQREADTIAVFNFGLLPDVTTGFASELHRTTAMLEGQINPDGQAVTSCKFEYGPTEAYGQSVPCSSLPGSGTSPAAVSAQASGLAVGSAYHFRLVAGNATGTHPGADSEFTTGPAVENVLTEAALTVTPTTATLPGSFEPNGFDTHYRFEYRSLTGSPVLTPLTDAGSASEDKHVSAEVAGLTPDALYLFRILAENQFGQTIGGFQFFKTAVTAPVIAGTPSASSIAAQSAVLKAELNPEHTTTHYHFQYAPCPAIPGCASIQSTADETSTVYGTIGTTQEIVGLLPATTYAYRLIATNEYEEGGEKHEQTIAGPEATFSTAAAPSPIAQTGGFSQLTPTSAVISGLVNPDGLPATYAFELGVYVGAGTRYGIVASGSAGSSTIPVEASLPLAGLQPGTTYAYRITISSGYISNPTHTLQGAPVTFTTGGLPAVLTPPAPMVQLAIPPIEFPTETAVPPSPKKLTRAQLLARALKACTKQPKRKRTRCRQNTEKRYGPLHAKRKSKR